MLLFLHLPPTNPVHKFVNKSGQKCPNRAPTGGFNRLINFYAQKYPIKSMAYTEESALAGCPEQDHFLFTDLWSVHFGGVS